jgi:hypothetical protein
MAQAATASAERGAFNYWKSAFLHDLSGAALEIMAEALRRCPSVISGLGIVPTGNT